MKRDGESGISLGRKEEEMDGGLLGWRGYGEGTEVVEYVPITYMADQLALYSNNRQVR